MTIEEAQLVLLRAFAATGELPADLQALIEALAAETAPEPA